MRSLILLMFGFLCLTTGSAHAVGVAQISNISDMNLPTWSIGDPAVSASMDVCIFSVDVLPLTSYTITASSPGGFVLKNGINSIAYSLYWEDSGSGSLGSSPGTQMSNGTPLTGRMNANILSSLCALGLVGPTARLNLKITQAAMTAALAGNYSGTITLLLSPT